MYIYIITLFGDITTWYYAKDLKRYKQFYKHEK